MNNSETRPNEDIENNEDQYSWIHLILAIPEIGGFLTSVIAIAPAILVVLPFVSENSEESQGESLLLGFLMLIVTWYWLNYLERKINLAICLPIPFIDIPIRWILYPFILPFLGLLKLYRYFVPKAPVDKMEATEELESEKEQ